MTEEPASALRARDLDDAFLTVDVESAPTLETNSVDVDAFNRFKGTEIKVYAPRTPLSAETSYEHDYPEHPMEMRCVCTPGPARAWVWGFVGTPPTLLPDWSSWGFLFFLFFVFFRLFLT